MSDHHNDTINRLHQTMAKDGIVESLNSHHDGNISKAEWIAKYGDDPESRRKFAEYDLSHDGVVDDEEWHKGTHAERAFDKANGNAGGKPSTASNITMPLHLRDRPGQDAGECNDGLYLASMGITRRRKGAAQAAKKAQTQTWGESEVKGGNEPTGGYQQPTGRRVECGSTSAPVLIMTAADLGDLHGSALADALTAMDPGDAAAYLSNLPPSQAAGLLMSMDAADAANIMNHMAPDKAAELLLLMDTAAAAAIMNNMDPDKLAGALACMPADKAAGLLAAMDPAKAGAAMALMDPAAAANIMACMDPDKAASALGGMDPRAGAAILARMSPSAAAAVLQNMEGDAAAAMLKSMTPSAAAAVLEAMEARIVAKMLLAMDACKDTFEQFHVPQFKVEVFTIMLELDLGRTQEVLIFLLSESSIKDLFQCMEPQWSAKLLCMLPARYDQDAVLATHPVLALTTMWYHTMQKEKWKDKLDEAKQKKATQPWSHFGNWKTAGLHFAKLTPEHKPILADSVYRAPVGRSEAQWFQAAILRPNCFRQQF